MYVIGRGGRSDRVGNGAKKEWGRRSERYSKKGKRTGSLLLCVANVLGLCVAQSERLCISLLFPIRVAYF